MARLWQGALLGCVILSVYYFLQSMRYIAPAYTRITWRNLFQPTLLAHREAFIGPGWQYRNRALLFLAGAGALLILGSLF